MMGDSTIIENCMRENAEKKPSRIPIAVSRLNLHKDSENHVPRPGIVRSKSFSTGSLNKLHLSASFHDFISKKGFPDSISKHDHIFADLSTFDTRSTYRQDYLNTTQNLNLSFSESVCSTTSSVRENNTSRKRFEVSHANHDKPNDQYLTPTQRKNEHIRELRARLRGLTKRLVDKDAEIARLESTADQQANGILNAKNGELQVTLDELSGLRNETQEVRVTNSELVDTTKVLRGTLELLKETLEAREREHETGLLQMYQRGMTIAQREREDELDEIVTARGNKANLTMHELLDKLSATEKSLSKWQSLRRQESYEEAAFPPTEAEATLRFLRDSFYHYLTSPANADDHLRAMIRIFGFTDVQRKKIAKAMVKGRKK